MSFTAKLNVSDLSRTIKNITRYNKATRKKVQRQVIRSSETVMRNAKRLVPVDHGVLKNSGYVNYHRGQTGSVIGFNAKYAAAVEFGSRPHIIRPRKKRGLANTATGQYFGKVVRHPGNRPQPYLMPSFERESRVFKKEILEIIKGRRGGLF